MRCSGKFQALLAAPQVEAVVVERVCLALAAMAARGGPATLQGFAGQALQLARDSCDAGDLVCIQTTCALSAVRVRFAGIAC